ncbi:hypothetical protein PFISCL1PPCAC_11820, partial [Pristionchus fissidentatus]
HSFGLSSMPPDIIRRIIRLEGESIENMRLISRTWNSLVLEHLQHRKRFPPIERVWMYLNENSRRLTVEVQLFISNRHSIFTGEFLIKCSKLTKTI